MLENESSAALPADWPTTVGEIYDWCRKNKLCEENFYSIHEGHRPLHSANWGSLTTHLMTEYFYFLEPDCDRKTLCAHYLPDGERYYYPIKDHPPTEKPENYCPKCLAMIRRYRVQENMLPDQKWRDALANFEAGRPYNYIPPYRMPPHSKPTAKVDKVLQQIYQGKPFRSGAFEFKVEAVKGQAIRVLYHNGVRVLSDYRERPPGEQAFLSALVVEPTCVALDRTYLQVAAQMARLGQANFSKQGREVFLQDRSVEWPENAACVLSRQSSRDAFQVSFEQRRAEDLEAARKTSVPIADSGDTNHPLYSLAVMINEMARECLLKHGKVLAYGEEEIPAAFTAAVANKRSGDGITFYYNSSGHKCATTVPAVNLRMAAVQIKRGYLKVLDEDDEPFQLKFA